ncbi:MAG: hypothetical protein EBZ77_03780, partial [Chitinophagia bacterium]|nr:hypothetical protein [Chitinophagia bacterium]
MKALFLLLVLFVAASSQAQIITTVAGNGSTTYSGDGGLALAAGIPVPVGVASDKRGNIYISSYSTHAIRKVDVFGIISVVAGNGTSGYSGDGGPATAAQLNYPGGICFDTSGNLLVADWLNNRVRIIDTLGVIRTYAGTSVGGFAGDGGAATAARLSGPSNIAFNMYGDLLIADHWNSRIRKVSALGNITTVAGNGFAGYTGDGGAATSASINQAIGIAVDNRGNIFIADAPNQVIRKVNCSDTITTYAGNGSYGYSGDGSAATSAQLWSPANVKTDSFGNLFVLDFDNSCIRKIDSFNIISTICGIGGSYGFSGDGGPASAARLSYPQAMDIDECGNYYIADRGNNRIRKITNSVISTTPGASVTIATYSDTVCASTSTTYNATVTGGGAFVSFLWLLNDSIVATSNSSTYTYTPANGDSV